MSNNLASIVENFNSIIPSASNSVGIASAVDLDSLVGDQLNVLFGKFIGEPDSQQAATAIESMNFLGSNQKIDLAVISAINLAEDSLSSNNTLETENNLLPQQALSPKMLENIGFYQQANLGFKTSGQNVAITDHDTELVTGSKLQFVENQEFEMNEEVIIEKPHMQMVQMPTNSQPIKQNSQNSEIKLKTTNLKADESLISLSGKNTVNSQISSTESQGGNPQGQFASESELDSVIEEKLEKSELIKDVNLQSHFQSTLNKTEGKLKLLKTSDITKSQMIQDQVQFNVKKAIENGDEKVTINLKPADLGKIEIIIDRSANSNIQQITINSQKEETKQYLQEAMVNGDMGNLQFGLMDKQHEQDKNDNAFSEFKSEDEADITSENMIAVLTREGLDLVV